MAAIAVVVNGLPQGLLALSFGFAALPTSLGFIVGTVGALLFRSVAPISFQAESIVLAGTMGKDRHERCAIVFITGVVMAIIGAAGLLEPTIRFIGPAVENGMMAGVGIILASVAVKMVKEQALVGWGSLISAVGVYAFSKNLVNTIVISVAVGTIVRLLLPEKVTQPAYGEIEKIKRIPLSFRSASVIRGALAMICLQIGGNIAYAGITGSIARSSVNVDHVTLYSGIADAVSSAFGGGPVEAIISGTGAAPNPVTAAVIMMGLMTAILIAGLLPIIGKRVPSESIAGFLFVLGAIVAFPTNIKLAISADPLVGGVSTVVTAATDPFIGLVAGVIVKFLMGNS
ncbi:MAG TPA: NCS2 family permease [Firmicutes bacterium]|nr:NCS2 family permease [Bacillota bacterium]